MSIKEEFEKPKEEDLLPQESQDRLDRLMLIAETLLTQAEATGVTNDTVKVINSLRQIILSDAELRLKNAKIQQVKEESRLASDLEHEEFVADCYKIFLDSLDTPSGRDRMRFSLSAALERIGYPYRNPLRYETEGYK